MVQVSKAEFGIQLIIKRPKVRPKAIWYNKNTQNKC